MNFIRSFEISSFHQIIKILDRTYIEIYRTGSLAEQYSLVLCLSRGTTTFCCFLSKATACFGYMYNKSILTTFSGHLTMILSRLYLRIC